MSLDNQAFALLLRRLDQQDNVLAEINDRAKLTNSRLSKLEIWKAQTEAVKATWRWVLPVCTSLGSGSGASLIIYLLTHH